VVGNRIKGRRTAMRIFADADVGKKNMLFGIALFVILGVGVGVPLTIDFLGGSTLGDQYQTWKVVHGYAVFLSFVNYFFGLSIDRLNLTRLQKEVASWSFLLAGLSGGLARPVLVLTSTFNDFGIYASLAETVFITLGTIAFVIGQIRREKPAERTATLPGRDATPFGPTHRPA
jgi:hypothetical protein